MGIGNGVSQRGDSLTEKRIAAVDEVIVSPSERATHIWTLLKAEHPDLTDWDVLCFAAEYMAMQSNVYMWLEEPVKKVVGLVYLAHYMNPETIDAASSLKRAPRKDGSPPQDNVPRRDAAPESEGDGDRVVKTRFTT